MTVTYGPDLLKVDNVSLSYGDKPVLRGVNAEIKEILRSDGKGQVVGFLGPSGIGKTSLFRIISGLDSPTSGQVILDGGIPVRAGLVGVVSQNYCLFDNRTVLGNLLLAARQSEKSETVCHDKIFSLLEEFDLTDKINLYPAQLSGGQKQRVAILQQILCSSHVLLFDEPFSGLDLIALEKVSALIQKVSNMDAANCSIVVTHDVTTACSVADHLWLLGRDRDEKGQPIPGASIKVVYDLVERDLCWHPDITKDIRFTEFVLEVKNEFRKL